jgi:hypothetical protein
MAKTGRNIRCKRCKTSIANSLAMDDWAVEVKDGQIAGYICPTCLKPSEASKLPEGATLDVGHGYESNELVRGGNFKFLKKRVDAPDYYGSREARFDWEQFSDVVRRIMEMLPNKGFEIAVENQALWNFKLSIEICDNKERILSSTGYHTHGMKKGKQIDEHLIQNLRNMGMTQPSGDQRNWTIKLTHDESVDYNLNKIIVHILERGYEFNPNLIQSIESEEFPATN